MTRHRRGATRPHLLEQRKPGRHQQEGAEPAEQHPQSANESEVAKAAVGCQGQHSERDARGGGGEQRRLRGGSGAAQAGGLEIAPGAAQLRHAREIDEAIVDSIPHHDRAEEGCLRIEIADKEPGEAEGHRHRDQHRGAQRSRLPHIAEEKKQREEHQRHNQKRRRGDVVQDGVVLGEEERKGAGEPDAQVVRAQLTAVRGCYRPNAIE